MACRHGLEEDCEPCDARVALECHRRGGGSVCRCGRWFAGDTDDCEECRIEAGELAWCARCEDVLTDAAGGLCPPCAVIRENASEAAWIARETDRFFGGS